MKAQRVAGACGPANRRRKKDVTATSAGATVGATRQSGISSRTSRLRFRLSLRSEKGMCGRKVKVTGYIVVQRGIRGGTSSAGRSMTGTDGAWVVRRSAAGIRPQLKDCQTADGFDGTHRRSFTDFGRNSPARTDRMFRFREKLKRSNDRKATRLRAARCVPCACEENRARDENARDTRSRPAVFIDRRRLFSEGMAGDRTVDSPRTRLPDVLSESLKRPSKPRAGRLS